MHEKLRVLQEYCGNETFTKFVEVLAGQARINNRLLFWQEQLLFDFSSATAVEIPTDLDGILSLFRQPAKHFRIAAPPSIPPTSLVNRSVIRRFRCVKQTASGGSHLTDFTVDLCSMEDEGQYLLADKTYPSVGSHVVDVNGIGDAISFSTIFARAG